MFDLNRRELIVVILLISSAVTGLGISLYRASQRDVAVEIEKFKKEEIKLIALDEAVEKSRIININEATEEDLMRLKGIGPALAERIIAHRISNGRFRSIEEIQDVKGIGRKLFDDIKDRISVE